MTVKLFAGEKFSISIETVVNIVRMLIEAEQVDKFIAQAAAQELVVEVPKNTANALKLFLHASNAQHPMAKSIMGVEQNDCNDYRCPHVNT